jgi:hypothetical protein
LGAGGYGVVVVERGEWSDGVVVRVRTPVWTRVPGFCALGYPARLECPGLLYPVVGIRVAALGLVFELIELVYHVVLEFELVFELVFELGVLLGPEVGLHELLYLVVPGFEPVVLVCLAFVAFELSVLVLGLPVYVCLAVVVFDLLWLVSLLVGPSFELSKLVCLDVPGANLVSVLVSVVSRREYLFLLLVEFPVFVTLVLVVFVFQPFPLISLVYLGFGLAFFDVVVGFLWYWTGLGFQAVVLAIVAVVFVL